jgi:hypothetical protein
MADNVSSPPDECIGRKNNRPFPWKPQRQLLQDSAAGKHDTLAGAIYRVNPSDSQRALDILPRSFTFALPDRQVVNTTAVRLRFVFDRQ